MSRMNELDLCADELRNATRSLYAAADSLAAMFVGQQETTVTSQTVTAAMKPNPVTLEQVRAVLAEKSRAGHTADVRALLEKHGAAKLSEIEPGEYAALIAEAEALGDG